MSLDLDIKDTLVIKLADHLQESINKVSQEWIGQNLIKTVKYYDSMVIARQDMPCLKVFRVNETYTESNRVRSTIAIVFTIHLQDVDKIASYIYFLSRFIQISLQQLLTKIGVQLDIRQPRVIQYNLSSSSNVQNVLPALSCYITVIENLLPNEVLTILETNG